MSKTWCIFVCGQSVFMQAIMAGLRQMPDVEVRQFDLQHPLVSTWLVQERPQLVIIEVGGEAQSLTSELLATDVPLLVVDIRNGRTKLLASETLPIAETMQVEIGRLAAFINQMQFVTP